MTALASSLRQTRILEITGNCLSLFLLGVGLFDQFMRFKLGGVELLLVCILIINYVNLFRSPSDRHRLVSKNWKRSFQPIPAILMSGQSEDISEIMDAICPSSLTGLRSISVGSGLCDLAP
jgi:hypothetical protein